MNGSDFLKHRAHKVWITILLIITGLILILGFFVNLYWSPILASKVKEVVLKSSDSLYKVDFSSAELHVLRGTIVIFNITLKPDTAVYNREKRQHIAPNNLVELHVKRLTLSHIHPFKLYFQHKLEIGEIVLNNPELNISYQLNHTKDTTLKDNRTAWQKISKNLHSISIGSIRLGDVKFKYEDYSGNKVAVSELKQMNLSARDLLIDSTTQTDKTRVLYCREIITELNDYNGKTASGLYSFKIKYLKLSTLKSQLNINGLTLWPVRADVFFNKTKGDRFTVRLDSVQLNKFDYLNYHKYRMLNAASLELNGGAVEIYSNPNREPNRKTDDFVTFPNVMIHSLNMSLKLDTIRARQLNINYTEFNKKSNKTGTIVFNHTSGQFLNVTTDKEALIKNNISTVHLSSYFMSQGKFDVLFTFNLTDKEATYTCKGNLGPLDLQILNKAVIPLATIKFNSGTVKRFDFDMQGNRYLSKGRVSILYNNLQVSLLKADTTFDYLKKMTIASLYANVFIIKHNNPDNAKKPARSFYVTYLRPTSSPFFKTLWKTLLEGIKPCAGLDKKTIEATVARIHEEASNKEDRKIKKAKRIERRTERRKRREEKKLSQGKGE